MFRSLLMWMFFMFEVQIRTKLVDYAHGCFLWQQILHVNNLSFVHIYHSVDRTFRALLIKSS
jgi:hypothetical protein